MAPKAKRDKFDEEFDAEMIRDFGTTEPLKKHLEELKQTDRWLPPLLQQLDEAAVFIFRDAWPRFTDWLRRSFPAATAALPSQQWAQIGWVALALLGVDWVISLGPRTGHNVTLMLGWTLAGFAGWHVWKRMQLLRRDELAQRFVQLTSQLGSDQIEQRISALGALDQLAFDNPRYRLPLVHLVAAWIEGRSPEQAAGHDTAVARQMVVEFGELLETEPVPPEPVVVAEPAAAPAEAPLHVEVVPEPAASATASEVVPDAEAIGLVDETTAPVLEVMASGEKADDISAVAEPALPAQEHTSPADSTPAAENSPVRNQATAAD